MDFYKRRRLIASKMKPLSLYEAGWSNLQNCSIKDSQVYSFKSDYLQIGYGDSSEAAFGRLQFTDIVNLNKYKKLFITYHAPSSNETIKIGYIPSNSIASFAPVQQGSLVYGTDATITFDINSSWDAAQLFSPGKNIYYFEHIQDLVGGMTNGI